MAAAAAATDHLHQLRRPPQLLRTISLKHVKLGYHYLIQNALYLLLAPLLLLLISQLRQTGMDPVWATLQRNPAATMVSAMALAMAATVYMMSRPKPVYMVDFSCYSPLKEDMCSNAEFLRYSAATGAFNEKSLEMQRKICERSGLGEETYLPPAVISEPPNPCMEEARKEAERVMCGALDGLFNGMSGIIAPSEVDILIVNCSLFVPTPSSASIIVGRYNMKTSVKSFNLGGMGCSAGVVAIDMARRLLHGRAAVALVVSMENITLNWYWGNDRAKLVSNCIFRMGGAAIMLTNSRRIKPRSKYELLHTVRTHKGADDVAFRCVFQEEDEDMNVGVSLSKELMNIAGNALKTNITTLAPLVLPFSEQLLFVASLLLSKLSKPALKPYVPDFSLAFEHFCIHAGGRAVLDQLQNNLRLSEWQMEPSRMTLFRFGNTSSSSLWYELAYTEAKGRIRKGDRLWQIAFGSGFKCNSAVWRSLRRIHPSSVSNPWSPFIHSFPVSVPTIRTLTSAAASSSASAAASSSS